MKIAFIHLFITLFAAYVSSPATASGLTSGKITSFTVAPQDTAADKFKLTIIYKAKTEGRKDTIMTKDIFVSSTDSISYVEKIIVAETGLRCSSMSILYRKKSLEENKTLKDYNITEPGVKCYVACIRPK